MSVAGTDLPAVDYMKVLGVVLDRRLSFDRHATSVARAFNFHAHAIRHIRHLLTTDCNAVLHGAPASSIQKLQRMQNIAAVLQAPRHSPSQPLLEQLHWLPVLQRIDCKLAVLTGCVVAQHCCKGDQPFRLETPKFDPPPVYPKPLNFFTLKFAQMITFGISHDVQNLVKIRLQGASPQIGEI